MRELVVEETRDLLVRRVANDFITVVSLAVEKADRADVVLTGGSVGIDVLKAVRNSPLVDSIDWSKVHIWWGDERFVAAGHADRNDAQAVEALLGSLPLEPRNVHPFPAAQGQSLAHARDDFAETLDREFDGRPHFDVVLNGIGPDGHVASLFPGLPHGNPGEFVIAVDDSPKPPSERLSLTFSALNAGEQVWIVAAGSDKADAIGAIMNDGEADAVPAVLLEGARETRVYVDSLAGAAST